MSSRKTWGLAAILGVIALVIGGALLSLESDQAEPGLVQYKAQYIDAGAMLRLTETLSSDALEGRATGSRGNEAARGFIQKTVRDAWSEAVWRHVFPTVQSDS